MKVTDGIRWLEIPRFGRVWHVLSIICRFLAPISLPRGVLFLLISTACAEVASNIVYVVLVEQAFQLGSAPAVAVVMICQAAAQVIFGSWEGAVADRWGYRKAGGMGALLTILLLFGLVFTEQLALLYMLAFLLMLAKLLILPARFGLAARLSDRSRLADVNTAILVLAGAGGFIGPAITAAFMLTVDGYVMPLLIAGIGWLFSIPAIFLIRVESVSLMQIRQLTFFEDMKPGWNQIRRRLTIRQVLVCLLLEALILGTVTPLFAPLSRQLELGSEGTGILFSALGLGYLIGPIFATILFKRMRLANALLIAGLLAPIGLILIGLIKALGGIIFAIILVSAAGAGINVIVTTIIQRLTPAEFQGSVLGTVQTLIGLTWIVSLGIISAITAVLEDALDVQLLLLMLGSIGVVSIFSCWIWNGQRIRRASEK